MRIKTIPYPKHLIVISNDEDTVTRLKLSPSDVALLHAECAAYLAYLGVAERPKPRVHQSGDYLEVVHPTEPTPKPS